MADKITRVYNPDILKLDFPEVIGIDLETTGVIAAEDSILSVAVASSQCVWLFDMSKYSEALKTLLFKKIANCFVIAHYGKFDFSFIYSHFGVLISRSFCTMLAAQILENGLYKGGYGLIDLLDRYLGVKWGFISQKDYMRYKYINHKEGKPLSRPMLDYVADDTVHLIPLYQVLNRKLKESNLNKVALLEFKLVNVLLKMELGGCKIDVDLWRNKIDEWETSHKNLERELDNELRVLSEKYPQLRTPFYIGQRIEQTYFQQDLFGQHQEIKYESDKIKYTSQKQIIKIFTALGLKIPSDGTKDSVDEDSLNLYTTENNKSPLLHFISILLRYRVYDKLLTTYGDNFLSQLDKNNYIHTQYHQCRTKTGRLSSTKPNLQNIPAANTTVNLRECFIAEDGYLLGTCDMDRAEIVIAADYSKEPMLVDAIKKGFDLHSKLATSTYSIIFGEGFNVSKSRKGVLVDSHELVPDNLRTDHKAVLFSKFYKGGARRIYMILAKYINMFCKPAQRFKVAKKISDTLDVSLPGLTRYTTSIIDLANSKGYLVGSRFGRRRFFPNKTFGQAANFPMQNANAEAMKVALINIDDYLSQSKLGRLVMNIHDEVVVEVLKENAKEIMDNVSRIMGESLTYFLNELEGKASYVISKHWEK